MPAFTPFFLVATVCFCHEAPRLKLSSSRLPFFLRARPGVDYLHLDEISSIPRLPVMLAARKLDGEDPKVVLYLRCAYAAVQTVAVFIVLFIYFKANAASKDSANAVKIYVSPPPQVSSCCHIFFRHLWRRASLATGNDERQITSSLKYSRLAVR